MSLHFLCMDNFFWANGFEYYLCARETIFSKCEVDLKVPKKGAKSKKDEIRDLNMIKK